MQTRFQFFMVPMLLFLFMSSVWAQDNNAHLARLQVIHNSADPAAEKVDIYVNSVRALDDFEFRSATNFIPLPANVTLNIGVAPGNSHSVSDTLVNFVVTLESNRNYIAVANGVLNPSSFSPNPNGRSTGFTLFVNPDAQRFSSDHINADLTVLHGATDAPTVDVVARNVGTLVDDASYGDFTPYLTVPPANYTLDVTDASGSTVVASFTADLTHLGGGAVAVFASGFLDPSSNQNGEVFGLFAALPNGQVVELPSAAPSTGLARLQVIHNSADPAAEEVDIYVDNTLLLDNFAFRTATPFIDIPAGQPLNIGVAPGSSGGPGDIIATFTLTLTPNETYVVVANGVLDPSSFAPNPNGRPTAFQLLISNQGREASQLPHTIDISALHGSTDAPTVDIRVRNFGTLIDNLTYLDFTGYTVIPALDYILDVTDETGTNVVASFEANLTPIEGVAAVVFASGFLDPSSNQNGKPFGLFAALPDGQVIELPNLNSSTTARLQVIHNSADPLAQEVDIYLDGTLLLDDFAFRTATPFIDAPAGRQIEVGVAPGTSGGPGDIIATFNLTLQPDETYIAVANGVLDPSLYVPNPDNVDIGFTLFINAQGRESSDLPHTTDLAVLHGATDAPTIDVVVQNVGTLVDNLTYSEFTDYTIVPSVDYILDVTDASGASVVASFEANLSGLEGVAAAVFASGFLDPGANEGGESFGLFAALPDGQVVELPQIIDATARLQVIHNAADPAAQEVDIYLNGSLLLDNFAFQTATPFIDAPADQVINIGVAPGNSGSAADTLVNFALTLADGETYVAVANGVLDPSQFAANPDGRSTGFGLFINAQGREFGEDPALVDLSVLHGSTDAPTVDVSARNVATLVDDASYGDFTGYLSVPAIDYTLDITDASGQVRVVTLDANLNGLEGGAAVVFASGFLNPAANQNGSGFGVFAALPDGAVVQLPEVTTARLQVIHNAADPSAFLVDVYLDGSLLLDNFVFRTATPFIDAPADQVINIGVGTSLSGGVADTLINFPLTLVPGETYIAVANGVLDPSQFAANPDGRNIGFGLFINAQGQEGASSSNTVDLTVLHGSTDAPTVDVVARNVATLVDDASYGDFTPYFGVPAAAYILDVTDASGTVTVASFDADLTGLGGGAAAVFASGFLDPSSNQNGKPFGVYAALPDGQVVELPSTTASTNARLQIIHNAADPVASVVDIYLNGTLLLDNFAFRSATSFIDAPAGQPINIGVAAANSSSVSDTLTNFSMTLEAGKRYVAIANGLLDPSQFMANPDGLETAFTLFVNDLGREFASNPAEVDLSIMHGSTDAPTVDIVEPGLNMTLADDIRYSDVNPYLSMAPGTYSIEITDAAGNISMATYALDLSTMTGVAATVFTSGFMNRSANQNGAAFGLFAAMADGQIVTLSPIVGIDEPDVFNTVETYELAQNYPNPFNPSTTIQYSLPSSEQVQIAVYNTIGQQVALLVNEQQQPGTYEVKFDASNLTSGVYIYRIEAGSFSSVRKMMLIK